MVKASSITILNRFLIAKALGDSFQNRSASADGPPSILLYSIVDNFLDYSFSSRLAVNVVGRIKKLWALLKRSPKIWDSIKDFLGISGLRDIPGKIKSWASEGKKAFSKLLKKALLSNPLTAMYFVPKDKMPNVTDILSRMKNASPWISKKLDSVNNSVVKPLDKLLAKNKFLRVASKPILAAIFIWVWLNVAEISWDLPSLVAGFTGNITVEELVSSLPESALGLLVAMLVPGLGTFALLPITVMARTLYLLHNRVMEWVKGKGFIVHWDKVGVDRDPEFVRVW